MSTPSSPDWVRPLGTTGLQVTALSVGGGPLGAIPKQPRVETASHGYVPFQLMAKRMFCWFNSPNPFTWKKVLPYRGKWSFT